MDWISRQTAALLLASSGAADRIVKVFEVATGTLARIRSRGTLQTMFLDVAWRGDGKMLASAGADGVIKFWDYASGDQLRFTDRPRKKKRPASRSSV